MNECDGTPAEQVADIWAKLSDAERAEVQRRTDGARRKANLMRYGTVEDADKDEHGRTIHVGAPVGVVCTAKGTHGPRHFGTAWVLRSGHVEFQSSGRRTIRIAGQADVLQQVGGRPDYDRVQLVSNRRRFNFRCPSCKLTRPITDEHMRFIITTVSASGLTSVDLSALPANLSSS